ncbi:MAG TPA: thioredoxin family protein [Spirochaetia bacterium]|nr:thioredoxin family protein [Spirochaetia bacterium]
MTVRMEVFSGSPPCPGCLEIVKLCEAVAGEYGAEIEFAKYMGEEGLDKFNEYNMFCVPAVVINSCIKIEGVVPSRKTLLNALREGCLCLR